MSVAARDFVAAEAALGARELIEYGYAQGWSDGLPVVPPVQEFVDEFLATTSRDPGEILMVQEHLEHTDSPVAKNILDNWRLYERAWVKVMPQDFKRVLAQREAQHASSVLAMQLSPDGGSPMESGHGIEGVPDHG